MAEPQAERASRFPDGFRILQGKQEYITYPEHASVRIWPSDVAAHFDSHVHTAIEIILPSKGVSVYQLPDAIYRVGPGETLIIPAGTVHSLTEGEGIMRHLFLFEPEPLTALLDLGMLSAVLTKPIYVHDDPELQEKAAALLQEVVEIYDRREPLWNTLCYASLMKLYACLGERYISSHTTQTAPARRADAAIMNSALSYINEHFRETLSLDDVAAFAGFSRYYFSRLFKQFCGMSFPEYLTQKRLKAATGLLIGTDKSMQSVAREAGFGSVATFNRVFQKLKSCTPTQFRAIYGTAPLL
ncbi:MAG: helix-turn-helix transcriptional regulator [Clostridia bacterium]|nr:helix-turn-helix transcriptional regulator [Clostridia bacterium]